MIEIDSNLVVEGLLDYQWYSPILLGLHVLFESLEDSDVELVREVVLGLLELVVSEGVDPVPEVVVVEVLVEEGLVGVVLGVFFGVLDFLAISEGGLDVVFIEVVASV